MGSEMCIRDSLQLPQTTHRKPQEPRRTFFSAKNGLKMAKNDQKPPKHVFFEIFRAIFSAKKCAEGAHAPCPLATTSNNPQKASGTPAHFFFGPKRPQNGQKRPKTAKIRIILRCFALFLAQKSARRVRTPRAHLQLPQTTPRKPQEPQRTFFSAENGLKTAKMTPSKCNPP